MLGFCVMSLLCWNSCLPWAALLGALRTQLPTPTFPVPTSLGGCLLLTPPRCPLPSVVPATISLALQKASDKLAAPSHRGTSWLLFLLSLGLWLAAWGNK